MSIKLILILAAVVTLVVWLPLLSVVAASGIAGAAGCRLDEGSAHPCRIAGVDLGDLLYSLQVLGWLFLATLPVAALSVLFWLGVLITVIFRRAHGG